MAHLQSVNPSSDGIGRVTCEHTIRYLQVAIAHACNTNGSSAQRNVTYEPTVDQRRIHMVCSKKDATAIGTNVSSDKSLGGEQQFKVTLQRLTTALEAMKHKFPGTKGKEYAMRMVVMPRMAYTGQGANISEAQIQRLDTVTLA